MNTALQAISEA